MAYASKKKLRDNSVVPLGSNLFGTCSTASATAQKDVTMPDFNVLVSGVTIHVLFTNENTASNPTLKVGSTSAVAIKRNGSLNGKWENGSVISFTYDGTNWIQNDADESSGTTYGLSYDASTQRISLVEGGGTSSVVITDNDTTYTLTISGNTLTLTPSSGTPQSVTLPDVSLKYVKDVIANPETYGVVINDVISNTASGEYSVAEGDGTIARGKASHAEGKESVINGDYSHAEGRMSFVDGDSAHAEGNTTTANGDNSHAEGERTLAQGESSHAEGNGTQAIGDTSHAEGAMTSAGGGYAHAEGAGTQANGTASHAEGNTTHAFGDYSHASGDHVTALGESQTAFGKFNDPNANCALIIGGGTDTNNLLNILTVDWSGNVRALGLVNEVLIYDKVNKLHVQGTIGSGKDGTDGLISQQQGEGTNRDITSWNIENMDLSAFRSLKIIARRNNATYGTTCMFELPLEGDTVPTRDIYVSGSSVSAHCDRNRLNVINCAVSGDKTKFCVTQTFSLYGTAATTVSDYFVEKIYGCY